MKIVMFNDEWYAEFLGQCLDSLPKKTSDDGRALAMSILFGFSIVAQAIDGAFSERSGSSGCYDGEGSVRDSLVSISSALSDIANAIESIEPSA